MNKIICLRTINYKFDIMLRQSYLMANNEIKYIQKEKKKKQGFETK